MNACLKRPSLSLLICLLSQLAVHGAEKAINEQPFEIFFPADRTVYGGGGVSHAVIKLNHPAASLSVRVNGKTVDKPKVKDAIQHYALVLDFGLNRVEVEAFQGAKLLSKETRQLFFFSPIAGEQQILPEGFVASPFHRSGGAPEKCSACHLLETQKGDLAPASPAASSCYSCHQDLTRVKNVHGPASLWMCLACHNPGSTPVQYTTPVPVRDLCYACHIDQKDYFFSSPYQHGPTATGMCTICHNPHGSNNEFWLKRSPWELCTTCHTEKASGRHVIAWGPSGQTHPTRGRPDPMKPEREFSCRSCHNPHASNMPKLWNFNVKSYLQLCQTCHNK